MPDTEYPLITCKTQNEWRAWLEENHATQPGVWLRMYKKDSKIPSINYAQALEEALCYGWIDGVRKSYDESSFLQKYTPRRAKSIWSKVNVAHIERLTKAGRMKASGVAAVEAGKADGRWDNAYESAKNLTLPEDFLEILEKEPEAKAFLKTLTKQNKFAIAFRLHQAKKPETRQKRMETFVAMLKEGQKFY